MAITTKAKDGKRILCALRLSRKNEGVELEIRGNPQLRAKLLPALDALAISHNTPWNRNVQTDYYNHDYGFASNDMRSLNQALRLMNAEDEVALTQHASELYSRELLVEWIEQARRFVREAWQEYCQPISATAELVIRNYEEL